MSSAICPWIRPPPTGSSMWSPSDTNAGPSSSPPTEALLIGGRSSTTWSSRLPLSPPDSQRDRNQHPRQELPHAQLRRRPVRRPAPRRRERTGIRGDTYETSTDLSLTLLPR